MKFVEVTCAACGCSFKRRKAEHNRSIKKKMQEFCSESCTYGPNGRNTYIGPGYAAHLVPDNRKDEHTPFKQHLRSIKARSKKNNRASDVDLIYLKDIWIEQNGICPLTGWKLQLTNFGKPDSASVDRIDSSAWYVKGNIRFIAFMANMAKHKFSDDDVIAFSRAVVWNNGGISMVFNYGKTVK